MSILHVIAVWVIGRIWFKKQLKWIQMSGLLWGLAAILLLNLQR